MLTGDATDQICAYMYTHTHTHKKRGAGKWDKGAAERDSETFYTRMRDVPPETGCR